MDWMFMGCNSLTSLDLSNFDTQNVAIMRDMFRSCSSLTTIYVGEKWSIESNTSRTAGAFPLNCELPNFSISNPNYRDLSYAHYGEGGYLTLKID